MTDTPAPPAYLDRPGAPRLAYRHRAGAGPTIVFLPGYMSDMLGGKAAALDGWAAREGRAMLRLDYAGCGESDGAFVDGTLASWRDDARAVIDAVVPDGPLLLVGSSMGGWLALLLARALMNGKTGSTDAAPMAGIVLIAPAVDFTEELMWKRFPAAIKESIESTGMWMRPSEYGEEPYPITKGLIEDGRKHLMMHGLIECRCPVHILQGVQDPDVPWEHTVELVSRFSRDDVVLTLIKDGDHRLSRPEDLDRLMTAVAAFT